MIFQDMSQAFAKAPQYRGISMTSKTYDLYGSSSVTILELRDKLERLLGVEFQKRDSDYLNGIYYRTGREGQENFVILSNAGAEDPDDLPEPTLLEVTVLLEVNATWRADAVRDLLERIEDLSFIRRKVV